MSDDAKKEIDKIMEIEKTVDREKLIYRASEYTYSFQSFKTIKTFGRDTYNGKITVKKADEDQTNLLVEIMNFKKKIKPQDPQKKQERKVVLQNLYDIFESREKSLMLLIVKYFQ